MSRLLRPRRKATKSRRLWICEADDDPRRKSGLEPGWSEWNDNQSCNTYFITAPDQIPTRSQSGRALVPRRQPQRVATASVCAASNAASTVAFSSLIPSTTTIDLPPSGDDLRDGGTPSGYRGLPAKHAAIGLESATTTERRF